jgi:hypothetical protein
MHPVRYSMLEQAHERISQRQSTSRYEGTVRHSYCLPQTGLVRPSIRAKMPMDCEHTLTDRVRLDGIPALPRNTRASDRVVDL